MTVKTARTGKQDSVGLVGSIAALQLLDQAKWVWTAIGPMIYVYASINVRGGKSNKLIVHCSVDPDEVLVGGGCADYGSSGNGALLTASYPENSALETWIAESKDHLGKDYHALYTYAIGMRLNGVSRNTLKSLMTLQPMPSV